MLWGARSSCASPSTDPSNPTFPLAVGRAESLTEIAGKSLTGLLNEAICKAGGGDDRSKECNRQQIHRKSVSNLENLGTAGRRFKSVEI